MENTARLHSRRGLASFDQLCLDLIIEELDLIIFEELNKFCLPVNRISLSLSLSLAQKNGISSDIAD